MLTLGPIRPLLAAAALAGGLVLPAPSIAEPTGWNLLAPCGGNCALSFYTGLAIEDSMADVLVKRPSFPTAWEYRSDDGLAALAFSRRAATIAGRIDLEPEIGLARRIGRQSEWEAWAALYGRYRGFPWDGTIVTTAALSTGLNWANEVSEVERDRAEPGRASRLLHFFSPEITLALPDRPQLELLLRYHHRSGAFGLVSEARGGAQYGTIGLRLRF